MTTVAVIQMTSGAEVLQNLRRAEKLVRAACEKEAKLVLLPENFCFMGFNDCDKLAIAEAVNQGFIQKTVSAWAVKYNIWIVAGSIVLKSENKRVRSACLVYDNGGKLAGRYDKIHLFDVNLGTTERYLESKTIEPGKNTVVVDTPIGRLGLSICYDLRFPELYRQLTVKGAEVFAIPSAFTAKTGAAHWYFLLHARAIENLAYVLASNQVGEHQNGRQTFGNSIIIDPWGRKLGRLLDEVGVASAVIDLEYVQKIRKQFPTNEHHVLEN